MVLFVLSHMPRHVCRNQSGADLGLALRGLTASSNVWPCLITSHNAGVLLLYFGAFNLGLGGENGLLWARRMGGELRAAAVP